MAAEILSIGPIQLNEEAGGLTVQTQAVGALDITQVYRLINSRRRTCSTFCLPDSIGIPKGLC